MRVLFFIVALVILVSCGSQQKLQKTYVGQPLSAIQAEFGPAKTVFNKESGDIYIFEKIEMLKSTEISQHKLTLDPMVTPRVQKTSHYTVTVVDNVITNVELEELYEKNN
ncbi:hypothetical protein SLH46_18990 [Draconibacterium sp. IB214405]|uniref:hypothetical protein n=1 Tax=Draconibacterium sp. IB214405 TaxID=3097352 RepID=UPI002A0F9B5C|nr:hypothetical protein [Draconibacterium sp. IB214405]MDX8341294.1 hypothetical protein [Draconibacterium sp. IB214405]